MLIVWRTFNNLKNINVTSGQKVFSASLSNWQCGFTTSIFNISILKLKMAFGDLTTDQGISALNQHLEDKSYILSYLPTQADVDTFKSISKAPLDTYPHALRWYNHIKSFSEEERKTFAVGACPFKTGTTTTESVPSKKEEPAAADDDDVDLFASDDEEDADAARVREERLKAYAEKKSKKPELIAKSSIVLDVKPWDDETDMKLLEESVKTIEMEGLVWGASKLVPVGYGINKLQIMCVVEDAKVSVDLLQEEIEKFEDYVQSVDVAAFNKI